MFMVNSSQGVPLNYSKLFDANSNVECYFFLMKNPQVEWN